MRFYLFAFPYKVKPSGGTAPWKGRRLWIPTLSILEPCDSWELFPDEGRDGPCDCKCCTIGAPHRHTGFGITDSPIGRDRWRKHWWIRKRR